MAVHRDSSTEPDTTAAPASSDADAEIVRVHSTTPDRAVFTEAGNCDGWISTDLLVDLEP